MIILLLKLMLFLPRGPSPPQAERGCGLSLVDHDRDAATDDAMRSTEQPPGCLAWVWSEGLKTTGGTASPPVSQRDRRLP